MSNAFRFLRVGDAIIDKENGYREVGKSYNIAAELLDLREENERLRKENSRLFSDGHEALEATEKEARRIHRLHPDRDTRLAIAKCVATASFFVPANDFGPEAERVKAAVDRAGEWLDLLAKRGSGMSTEIECPNYTDEHLSEIAKRTVTNPIEAIAMCAEMMEVRDCYQYEMARLGTDVNIKTRFAEEVDATNARLVRENQRLHEELEGVKAQRDTLGRENARLFREIQNNRSENLKTECEAWRRKFRAIQAAMEGDHAP